MKQVVYKVRPARAGSRDRAKARARPKARVSIRVRARKTSPIIIALRSAWSLEKEQQVVLNIFYTRGEKRNEMCRR